MESDVSGVLAAVRVPTLVVHREPAAPGPAEYFAERMRGLSTSSQLPDLRGAYTWIDDVTHELDDDGSCAQFVAGLARERSRDRVLATILFTDIVGSTRTAAAPGRRRLAGRCSPVTTRSCAGLLARYRGEELDTAGDGFFAVLRRPGRAIACAREIRDGIRDLGLAIRAGVHTGECERVDGKLGGLAVSIGARVATEAEPGEVLVTGTVRDLVAGSGIAFEERGERELKGVPGSWRLYAVADA